METVFNKKKTDHLNAKMFLDGENGQGISRTDTNKYKVFDKMFERMQSLFWIPEEIDISKDRIDFNNLSKGHQHIFTSNLKRQILLDTVQGRALTTCFLPVMSLPELEECVNIISFEETVHSRSYMHVIRNVYNDPSEVLDGIMDIPEIMDCAESVTEAYDKLHIMNCKRTLQTEDYSEYEHKKAIYLALIAWNALESLRFYVSFACSWAFAEQGVMVGNADIIRLISREEEEHRMFTQVILRFLKGEPDFEQILEDCEGDATQIFIDVAIQERTWAEYLFKDTGMIGLNAEILGDYVEWLTDKRMGAVGLASPFKGLHQSNPLPWTSEWISSKNTQEAPQEKEKTSYLLGVVDVDVSEKSVFEFNLDEILKEV